MFTKVKDIIAETFKNEKDNFDRAKYIVERLRHI